MFLSPSVQFFKLDVLYEAPNGELSMAPASHIMQQLEAILCTAADPAPYPVGILTTEHRDTWAQARERLASGEGGTVRGSGLYELPFEVSSPQTQSTPAPCMTYRLPCSLYAWINHIPRSQDLQPPSETLTL